MKSLSIKIRGFGASGPNGVQGQSPWHFSAAWQPPKKIARRTCLAALAATFAAGPLHADPPPPVPAAPPPTATVEAEGVIGRRVLGPDGREIGRVVDVLVDANSQPRAAVIDFGGFLGVGTRRIAVDWSDMTFPPPGRPPGPAADIQLDLPAEKIASAPAYTDQTRPAAVVQPSAGLPASGH